MSSPQCQCIIDAAEKRIAHYGYNKTTMAEIAADCQMSVGNLYRHFPNKSTIAASTVVRNMQKKQAYGLKAAEKETAAWSQLTSYLVGRLRFAHEHFAKHRHLHECVNIISTEHCYILSDAEAEIIKTLRQFIQYGMDSNQLRTDNPERIASLIHFSMMRYNFPLSIKHNSLESLEKDLRDALQLFYEGLAC